ncbi:hypothetical protein KFU94_07785 [Chloroflexi bacterium TSY]|nr:hypothetical protein [Chloroflexi bacterium TSY]
MATLQITSEVNIDLNQLLASMSQLDTHEIEQFLAEVNAILVKRKGLTLTAEEECLLHKINQDLPDEIQLRHRELEKRCQMDSISIDEGQELLNLTEQLDSAKAERLRFLRLLAKSRRCTLSELQSLFGNAFSDNVHAFLNEELQNIDDRLQAAKALLKSWDEEGDEQEQSETLEYLKRAIDEDRLSDRKLFS